ncbi:MAG TPA: hypothetical protein VHW64_19480 [Nocardioides sp.]|jgi:hypothetical protein|uniref:hypothetical protein n=1 Tax=Nocardioides sp. TaxID=35761 RepID=UPI002E329291|nr:hypothetical protein [Nocardioides sp.]HEX3932877.1 hypothetical protein [Nocardioides sp.]
MTSRLVRHGAARLTAGAVVAGGLLAMSMPGAHAALTQITFDTPTADTPWQVPVGVTRIVVTAYGAQGGSGSRNQHTYGTGGYGAELHATFAVVAGQVLDLTVGGAGNETVGGVGGGGAGGVGADPGSGGGGASVVSLNGTPWLVAGGGGGAADYHVDGGDSGATGLVRDGGLNTADGRGGGGATAASAGSAGAGGSSAGVANCAFTLGGPAGSAGASLNALPRAGGTGGGRPDDYPRAGGGGGGGGYTGGGGGGGGAYCVSLAAIPYGAGGGGGGGSSLVSASALAGSILQGRNQGDGSITISYSDSAGPTASPTLSPAPNVAGWNNTRVTVNWNWTDETSGIDTTNCTQQSSTGTHTGELVLDAVCEDTENNVSQDSVTVRVDPTAPVAAPTRDDAQVDALVNGWTRGPVTLDWNWADSLSGVDAAACTTSSTASGNGVHQLTARCADVAGNAATASKTVRVDRKAPKVVVKQPKHRVYHRGQRVVVRYRCRDAGVGVATCSSKLHRGALLPTKKVGRHVVRIKAVDRLGNMRVKRIVYRVTR